MSDQNVETVESTDAATEGQNLNSDTVNANGATQTPTKDSDAPNQEKTFTQADINRIVARAESKAKELALKELQDKQAEAEMSELEKLKKRLAEVEGEKTRIERERLIDRIAADAKLPVELRDRLRGETEEELREDAKQLAKFTQPAKPEAPDLDATRRGGSNGEPTDAEKEELNRRFRIR
jgi:hypothetical protein